VATETLSITGTAAAMVVVIDSGVDGVTFTPDALSVSESWMVPGSVPVWKAKVAVVALAGMAALAGAVDWRVAQNPDRVVWPFRLHMALGAIFLAGVVVSLYLPPGFL